MLGSVMWPTWGGHIGQMRAASTDLQEPRRARQAPGGSSQERRPRLTEREQEVLVLLATGRSNRQIADELGITEKTVGIHVSHILTKLGAARRTEAVFLAFGMGLLASAFPSPTIRPAEQRRG